MDDDDGMMLANIGGFDGTSDERRGRAPKGNSRQAKFSHGARPKSWKEKKKMWSSPGNDGRNSREGPAAPERRQQLYAPGLEKRRRNGESPAGGQRRDKAAAATNGKWAGGQKHGERGERAPPRDRAGGNSGAKKRVSHEDIRPAGKGRTKRSLMDPLLDHDPEDDYGATIDDRSQVDILAAVQGAIRRDRELETATEGLAHSAPRGKDAELSRFDSDSEDSDGGLQTAGRGMAVEKGGKSGTGRGERAPETSDDEERGGSGDNAPGRVLEFAKGGRKGKKVDLSRFEDSDSEGEVRGGEEEDSEGEPDDNKEEDESEEYAGIPDLAPSHNMLAKGKPASTGQDRVKPKRQRATGRAEDVGPKARPVPGELTHAGAAFEEEEESEGAAEGARGSGGHRGASTAHEEADDGPSPSGRAVRPGGSTWESLGLAASLCAHLTQCGFARPTRVQRDAVPAAVAGRDVLVNAPTGSGKTLSFLLPVVNDLQGRQPRISRADGTYMACVAPTRELASQISDVATVLLRRYHWIVGGLLTGGENRVKEKARLRKGVSLVVATPGRLLDHLQNTQSFETSRMSWLILDEGDRLLDMGFAETVHKIIALLEQKAAQRGFRRILCSATLHSDLHRLASMSLRDPYPVGFRIRKGATGVLEIRERVGGEGAADGAQRGDDGGRGGGEGARGGDGSGGGEEEARGARGGAAGSAPQGGEEGTFKLPHTLKQKYVEVTAKTRLPALLGLFRSRTSEGGKVVVFVSSCDGVEFLHLLATRAWDAAVAPREGGSGEDEDDFGEQRSRVRGAGPPAKKGGAGGKRGRLADAAEIGPCLHAPIVKLHGNMPQSQRTASFLAFVRAQSGVLICTDVAARGLDFPEVTSIVQYDPPGEPQEYVHRVGRTARMGREGEAVLLLLSSELSYVKLLEGRGVSISRTKLERCLSALPFEQLVRGGSEKRRKKDGTEDALRGIPDRVLSGSAVLMRFLIDAVSDDPEMTKVAESAFRSYIRAYAAHPRSVRHIFHVKKLHLGHTAHCFALRQNPTLIGKSATKEAAKARKKEDVKARKKATLSASRSAYKNADPRGASGYNLA